MTGIIDDIVKNNPKMSLGIKDGQPKENPVDNPANNPIDNPVDKPVDKPVDDAGKNKIENPSDPKPEDFSKKMLSNINERLGTQYNDLDSLKNDYSQLNTLRESEKQLQERLQNVSNPFDGDNEMAEIYGFRKETNRGIDDYFLLKGIDLDTADSLDIMVADAILNNPALKNKNAAVRKAFEKKYDLVGEDLDESDIESNRITLDIDSSKSRVRLSELKNQIKAPDFESNLPPAFDAKAWEQDENTWKENIPRITNALSSFKIFENPDDEKNGKDPFSTIEIPNEVQNIYKEKLQNYISESKIKPTEENINQAYGLMLQDYVINNYMDIAKNFATRKIEVNNAMWKERTGVDISKLGKDVVPGDTKTDVEKFNQEQLKNVLGKIGVKGI